MPFVEGEDRRKVSMMFIHDIDNNILNSGGRFLRVYQDEYEIWGLYNEVVFYEFEQIKTLASSKRISHKLLVNDLIVVMQGANKVVLLPSKFWLVLSRLPIKYHQSVLGVIGLLMYLSCYLHLHWYGSFLALENDW